MRLRKMEDSIRYLISRRDDMRKVIGVILFLLGFWFLLAAGSAVDLPSGTAIDVFKLGVVGSLSCAVGVFVFNWELL